MARPAASLMTRFRLHRSTFVVLVAAVLLLYAVVPQLGYFHHSLASWRHVEWGWLGVALLALLGSYCLAAGVYVLLAWQRLSYPMTVLMQVAGMFANRLLPAGAGAISVNYLYLRRSHHSKSQAIAAVALNNIMGFLGNMLLLLGLVLVTRSRVVPPHAPSHVTLLYILIVILVVLGVLFWRRRLRQSIWRGIIATIHTIIAYRHRSQRLVLALIVSMLLAACYTVCLLACARALDVHVVFTTLFIVMTVGVVGSVVVPTPGGLGGAEAGLVAALVVYGVSSTEALAVALLYRLFTYWLSLALGAAAFVVVERRQLLRVE